LSRKSWSEWGTPLKTSRKVAHDHELLKAVREARATLTGEVVFVDEVSVAAQPLASATAHSIAEYMRRRMPEQIRKELKIELGRTPAVARPLDIYVAGPELQKIKRDLSGEGLPLTVENYSARTGYSITQLKTFASRAAAQARTLQIDWGSNKASGRAPVRRSGIR